MTKRERPTESKKFIFRKYANIGSADATEDTKFLEESFVDNGALDILQATDNPLCTVLGRTGSGKTALLERIRASEDRVIKIEPEGLALTFVSDSNVIRFFIAAGVSMEPFYRLLWRHIFAVELLREYYQITNQDAQTNFLTSIARKFQTNRPKQRVMDYLQQWGDNFWLTTEYRVHEITRKLETELKNSLDVSLAAKIPNVADASLSVISGKLKSLTEEEKGEIHYRGQEVVSKMQIQVLTELIEMLENDLLDDKQKKFYITVDRLDENWVNDELRYHLIRALLDTIRDFNHKIKNVKIIIAIREDLLDRVFRYTRSPGYQEEKYRSMYMSLSWTREDLEELLDKRVNQLIREQYTSQQVQLKQLFPSSIGGEPPLDYFFARTMMRPRDAIMFFNEFIKVAEGKAKFSQPLVVQAEVSYSQNRLRALADEWAADYPNLIELTLFLKKFPTRFKPALLQDEAPEKMLHFLTAGIPHDAIFDIMTLKFESDDISGFVQEMIQILFKVGILGVKPESYNEVQWSYLGHKLIQDEINKNATICIHPAFWRVLGCKSKDVGQS